MILHEKAHELAKKSFITLEADCLSKHGDKYNYDIFVFKTLGTKSTIGCPIHGEFEQSMQMHLKGECPKCARETVKEKVKKTKEEFASMLEEVHPNLTFQKYNGYKVKTKFTCSDHPKCLIEATPTAILRYKFGCKECCSEAMRLLRKTSPEEFEKQVRNIHNNNIKVLGTYTGTKDSIEFRCETHEEVFTKRPFDVLQGRGCNICGGLKKYRKYLDEPTILYYVYFEEFDLYKIGITIKRVGIEKRLRGYGNIQVLDYVEFNTGKEAYEAEQMLITSNEDKKYIGEKIITAGNKELFTCNIFSTNKIELM